MIEHLVNLVGGYMVTGKLYQHKDGRVSLWIEFDNAPFSIHQSFSWPYESDLGKAKEFLEEFMRRLG